MTIPTWPDFLRERVGNNWVLARRTPRIVARYGADVVCLSGKQLRELEREYRKAHGDPHDKVRAELYRAAREAADLLMGIDPNFETLKKLRRALQAETERT